MMITPILITAAVLAAPAAPPSIPQPEGEVFALSTCGDCRHTRALVAGGAPGTFTAAWGASATFSTFFRTFDVNGNGGPEHQIAPQSQSRAAGVGATGDGGFVLGWLHPGKLYAQRLTPTGVPSGEVIHVNAGHPAGVDDDDPVLAAYPGGGFLVAWDRLQRGTFETPVMTRRVDAGGNLGPEVEVGRALARTLPVACTTPKGTSVVGWSVQEVVPFDGPRPIGFSVRRLAPNGAALGKRIVVVPPVEAFMERSFALACAPDGGFAVAWYTGAKPARVGLDVMVQRFNAAGRKVGKPLLVNLRVEGDQSRPALLYGKDGRLLVVWASAEGEVRELRGRFIPAKGRPVEPELVLHQGTPGAVLSFPAMTSVGEREQFVLVWSEGGRLFGRVFR